jgi:hypothetical protein
LLLTGNRTDRLPPDPQTIIKTLTDGLINLGAIANAEPRPST